MYTNSVRDATFGPQAQYGEVMSNPAEDRRKRLMVAAALRKLTGGALWTRVDLFKDYGTDFNELQKRVVKQLQAMGVVRKVATANPSVVKFVVNNRSMLDSVLKSEGELTRLIWPSAAPSIEPPAEVAEEIETELQRETASPSEPISVPRPIVPGTSDQLLADILERQDLILQKVIDPIGENILWVRDRIVELRKVIEDHTKSLDDLHTKFDRILKELT